MFIKRIVFALAFIFVSLPGAGWAAGGNGDTFRFLILADTHVIDENYSGTETAIDPDGNKTRIDIAIPNLELAIDGVNRMDPPPDFVIVVGDIVHNFYKPVEYYEENKCHHDIAKEMLDRLNVPWYGVIGNHDMSKHIDAEKMRTLAPAKWGAEKIGEEGYYSFDHRGVRFIILNQYWCHERTHSGKISSYCLGNEQFDWLSRQLETDMPVFIFAHEAQMRSSFDLEKFESGSFKELMFENKDHIMSFFYGHLHRFLQGDRFMNYGIPWYIIGSTRYNPDARMEIEVSPSRGKFRITNKDEFRWGYN